MSIVTVSKRRTHPERCLHPSTTVTHSTAQPTLTQKFSRSHSPLLISFSLILCLVFQGSKRTLWNETGGWECISAVLTVCTASGGCYLSSISMETQELSYHLLKGLHAPHSLGQNNFHSEEDLNNIFLSISSAMAKVTDNTFLENVKTLITIYNIYQGQTDNLSSPLLVLPF